MIYKVQMQIQKVNEAKSDILALGRCYEAGRFNSQKAARNFVENELLIIREVNTKLRNTCRAVLKLLSSLGKGGLITLMQKLALCRKMLHEAVNCKIPAVDDNCPKCGAGSDQREFVKRDFLDIEAIHVHYTCKKCGSEIIEEFTLSEVFIDSPRT
jgi:predicted nucleic-acid-binding Zn-ribbon protein